MTEQDYNTINELYGQLEDNCSRVARIMRRVYFNTYDDKYKGFDAETPCGITDIGVFCKDDDGYAQYECFIKKEWLLMTDDELNKMADELIVEWQKKKEEAEKLRDEKIRQKDIAEYERLKAKLGL